MRWRSRRRFASSAAAAGAVALVAFTVSTPAATAGRRADRVLAHWGFGETSGTVVHDSVPSGHDGTIGASVVLGGGQFDFPGWTGNVSAKYKLTGQLASADSSLVQVPADDLAFSPGYGPLRITVRLKARLVEATNSLPKSNRTDPASYNVVQLGKAPDPGGQWKIEIMGHKPVLGKVHCTFRDSSGGHVDVFSSTSVADGAYHTVMCGRLGNSVWVQVDANPPESVTGTLGDVVPVVTPYGVAVWIGKKPASYDPGDAFSGWIDDVEIAQPA